MKKVLNWVTRYYFKLIGDNYTHVYIDESISEKAGLATLTSIFIPQRQLKKVTRDFYLILGSIIDKFPEKKNKSKIIYPPPILHGNSLLQNTRENKSFDFSTIDDDFRITIFKDIIDLILKHKLQVVRLGYNNYSEILKTKFNDNKMYSTNWLGLSTYIDGSIKIKNAICVMEGNNMEMIHKFSWFISTAKANSYLYPDVDKSSIFGNSKKFVGNVFYVPARYCEYLQIVDIISYILHKKDYVDITGDKSDFIMRIYELNLRLDNKRLINHVKRLNFKNVKS